jgi:CRISPR/Cas system Type II protein with McrA/HNH and RuvC-like nuclease domain
LPDQWRDLKGKFSRQIAAFEALHRSTEEQEVMLHRAEEAWENFSEFLVAHGVDPETLTIENFAAMRAEHLPAPATVELSVDEGDDLDLEQYEYYPVDHDIPLSPEQSHSIPLSPEEF